MGPTLLSVLYDRVLRNTYSLWAENELQAAAPFLLTSELDDMLVQDDGKKVQPNVGSSGMTNRIQGEHLTSACLPERNLVIFLKYFF